MKKVFTAFTIVLICLYSAATVNAQDAKLNLRNFDPAVRKASFKVHGECAACKQRIESALKVEGIKKARWDVETKMLHVQYVRNEIITGEYKLQQLVAAAGHDTHKVAASDVKYLALPACCRYERGKP